MLILCLYLFNMAEWPDLSCASVVRCERDRVSSDLWMSGGVSLSKGFGGSWWRWSLTNFVWMVELIVVLSLGGGIESRWNWYNMEGVCFLILWGGWAWWTQWLGWEGFLVLAKNWVPIMSWWVLRGRILVSLCKCWTGVVWVQPVIVLRALFCAIWSFALFDS